MTNGGMHDDEAVSKLVYSLKKRYRSTQIKAAVAVNSAMLEFYWSLGADISRMYPGKKRNLNFFENLSNDLCLGIDNPGDCLLRTFAMHFASMSCIRAFHWFLKGMLICNMLLKITGRVAIFSKLLKIRRMEVIVSRAMTSICQRLSKCHGDTIP